jgi:hypothetical protein
MRTDERWVFSFRYTRRGLTNLWERTGEVAVELTGGADLDEARAEAGERADAEFRRRHPPADLAG